MRKIPTSSPNPRPNNPFPVTIRDGVAPTDPKLERSREDIATAPESLVVRMERTRRYFRLTHLSRKLTYARGLDSRPDEMA